MSIRISKFTMQKLVIVIFLALNSSHPVQCTFFGTISNAFEEMGSDLYKWYVYVKNQLVKGLINTSTVDNSELIVFRGMDVKNASGWRKKPQIERMESPALALAARDGRELQTHPVYTGDGYVLTLHRLALRPCDAKNKGVVFLHHGLLGSSADWLLRGPDKALPYLLSDAGYDVWLANSRGNYYSRTHMFKEPDSKDYWNFSWQEIGERDLPAIFEYIMAVTDQYEGLNYVGHGMGATALLVLLSVKPEYNQFVRMGVLLGPLAIMKHARGPLRDLSSKLDEYLFTEKELFPSNRVPQALSANYCEKKDVLCRNTLFFFVGGLLQYNDTDRNFMPDLQHSVPAGASEKTLQHYVQLILNGKFHKYGDEKKLFPLDNIEASIAILSSSDDMLSDVFDNNDLYTALPNAVSHIVIQGKEVSHTEFVWGFNADTVIYNDIMTLIANRSIVKVKKNVVHM